jgi:hypothetical protein
MKHLNLSFKRSLTFVLPLMFFVTSYNIHRAEAKSPTPTASPLASTASPLPHTSPSPAGATSPGHRTVQGGVAPKGETCPPTAPIKGKDGRNGKIYHLPNTSNYASTKPTVCFANVNAAKAAGYHAPKNQTP